MELWFVDSSMWKEGRQGYIYFIYTDSLRPYVPTHLSTSLMSLMRATHRVGCRGRHCRLLVDRIRLMWIPGPGDSRVLGFQVVMLVVRVRDMC